MNGQLEGVTQPDPYVSVRPWDDPSFKHCTKNKRPFKLILGHLWVGFPENFSLTTFGVTFPDRSLGRSFDQKFEKSTWKIIN